MTVEDRAFERLRLANPAPVTAIEERPAASVALASIQDRPAPDRLRPLPTKRGRRGPAVVVALIVALLLIGLPVLLFRGTDDVPPATEPAPPPTGALFDSGATPLIGPAKVVEGSYLIDRLGTPLSVSFDEPWILQDSVPGFVALTESATGGGSNGTLLLIRATELSDPADPFAPIDVGSGLAPTELDTWLTGVDESVIVSEVGTVDVGGRSATRFDVTLTEAAPCGSGTECGYLVTSRGYRDIGLAIGDQHRVWWIVETGFDPIVVVARGDGSSLFGQVEALLATIGFGVAAPHPVSALRPWEAGVAADAPAGRVRLPAMGGIEFELASSASIDSSGFSATVSVSSVATVDIAFALSSRAGDPIDSIDDAVAALVASGTMASEVDWSRSGSEGRAFDISRSSTGGVIVVEDEQGATWVPPANGRIWLIATERGVLFVAAGALEGTFGLEDVIAIGERVADTIALTDPP